jgi:hypothetical protein
MHALLTMLGGGDRRSIGRANEVAALVEADPAQLPVLISGMSAQDPLIRMRCADAAEKATLRHTEHLQPHKSALLGELSRTEQAEVRWHVAQMLPRLALSASEQDRVFATLTGYLGDASSIVRTCALQGLHDLALKYPAWRSDAIRVIAQHAAAGSAAMRARGRKLLATLDGPSAQEEGSAAGSAGLAGSAGSPTSPASGRRDPMTPA